MRFQMSTRASLTTFNRLYRFFLVFCFFCFLLIFFLCFFLYSFVVLSFYFVLFLFFVFISIFMKRQIRYFLNVYEHVLNFSIEMFGFNNETL